MRTTIINFLMVAFPLAIILIPLIMDLLVLLRNSQRAGIRRYLHHDGVEDLNNADRRAIKAHT